MRCYIKENNQYRFSWISLTTKEQKLKKGDIIYRDGDKMRFRVDKVEFKKGLKFYLSRIDKL